MKHLLTILSGLLVALLFARCADDDNLSGGIDGLPERGIVIRLSTGELDTRTQLTSTGDYHHVEEVWAVLYKLKDGADAETATEADFEYKTHEKLDWEPMTEEEYGEGNPQGKEFLLHTDGTVLTNGTYRVLCIGLDDRSGAVYSLTNGNSSSSSLQGFSGKTLAEALAVIRSNKDCTELKPVGSQTSSLSDPGEDPSVDSDEDKISMNGDPATAELFAGWEEFVFEEDNINIVEVVLKRRVAGILCYLTDVPLKVNYDGKEQYVTGIRLCLASPAATSISLCRKEGNPTEIEGFGTLDENGGTIPFESLEGNKVTTLAYYQLPYEEQNYDITNTKETFQEGGETANYLMGVYMLPVKCTVEEILFVQLMVQEDKPTSQNQGYETGLYLPDGRCSLSMGQPGPKFIVKESNSGKKDFDIRPNYIYHIGNKDDDIDEPVSLLGQELLVDAKAWTDETIPVEFPSVPIKPKMDIPYGASYVFDCIPQTITIEVTNSILNSPWTLQAGNGIYFKTDKGYSYQYEAKETDYKKKDGPVEVEMLIADFAELDAPDMREIEIKLLGEDKTTVVATHTVKQYSAIVVETEENVYRGFSRFDLGTDRNSVDGSVVSNEGTWPWNYYYNRNGYVSNWSANDIYGTGASDSFGETNLINAKSKAQQEGEFTLFNFVGPQNYEDSYDSKWADIVSEESAIYAAGLSSYTGEATSASLNGHYWYLPAHNEMEAFIKKAVEDNKIEEWNLVRQRSSDSKDDLEHHKYWTSTAYGTLTAHTHYINAKGKWTHDLPTVNDLRTYWRHVRRACDITAISN